MDDFVDASFIGDRNSEWSGEASSVMSRTGYVINYANFLIIWCNKLQTEIALLATESEYIVLSQSLKDFLPLIELLREIRITIPSDDKVPVAHCTIFEDNKGCNDLVKTPRMRPRTEHIVLKYHHFRSSVKSKSVSINYA